MNFIIGALLVCSLGPALALFSPNDPGETSPGRVEIATGSELVLYCTMNLTWFPGRNSSDLAFYVGERQVPREYIRPLNATTIEMRMRNAPEQEAEYRCQCGPSAIMESLVYVGTRPQRVRDFSCRSYDYTYMECNFTVPYNPLVVQYNLSFYTAFPDYTNPMNCTFSKQRVCRITSFYRPCIEQYHIVLNASNALGWEKQVFTIDNFDVMVLAPPGKDVRLLPGYPTTEAVMLSWHMQRSELCSPKLQWEVMVQPDGFAELAVDAQPQFIKRTREWSLELAALPYAFYWYTLRMRVKLRSSPDTEEMWSAPLVYRFRTASRAPSRPPRTAPGSYYIDSSETRVRLYWEELPPHEHAGDRFNYTVSEVLCNGQMIDQQPLQLESNSALFAFRKNATCEYHVRSVNRHGQSPLASRIVVFAHSNSRSRTPQTIHNLYHDGNSTYTLSWKAPSNMSGLRNYTVYWCHSKRALQNGCNGSTHFAQVEANVTRFTTAPQDHTLNLAVSANYDNYNTGMHWTECTLDVNSDLVKIEPEARAIRSSALQIEWSPGSVCPVILDGYNLTYCEVAERDSGAPTTTSTTPSTMGVIEFAQTEGNACVSTPISLQLDKIAKKYILGNLKPYTKYKLEMFMYSSTKVGKVSDSLYRRTLEAAPTPPRDLTVSHVTNTSATFTWLPPRQPNGLLREYVLTVNNHPYPMDADPESLHEPVVYVVTNLTSYTTYQAYVVAHTVDESSRSNVQTFTTMIGYPSMPSNTWVRNSANDTTIQWSRPSQPSGRVEFYEVAVTQTRHQEVLKQRISFIYGETMCLVKSASCTDPEVRTKIEVRAVNAALLTHEVAEYLGRPHEGFSPAPSYYDGDELACIGEQHSPHEVEHRVAAYRNHSAYQLYHSAWQFAYESSCAATGLSKKTEVALIVVVAALVMIGPLYLASKQYNRMANINCKLPADLDVYVTKDGPPRDLCHRDDFYDRDGDMVGSGTAANATAGPPTSRPIHIMPQLSVSSAGHEFVSHNEKHHLLPQHSSASSSYCHDDSSGFLRADSRLYKRDDSIDCSLDCGSSVKTQQTTLSHLDNSNETGSERRRYLRSQSECSARSALSEDRDSSLETVEMDQMLLVEPSTASSYVDAATFQAPPATKLSGYVNPSPFANWPAPPLAPVMANGYISVGAAPPAAPRAPLPVVAASSPYVQATDLQNMHFNMTVAAAATQPQQQQQMQPQMPAVATAATMTRPLQLPASGYTTLDDLHKFGIAPTTGETVQDDSAETALLANAPPPPRAIASNYVNPTSFSQKAAVVGGYVTPRDLNVLAGSEQH